MSDASNPLDFPEEVPEIKFDHFSATPRVYNIPGTARGGNKTHTVTMCVTGPERALLRKAVGATPLSASEWIRRVLFGYVRSMRVSGASGDEYAWRIPEGISIPEQGRVKGRTGIKRTDSAKVGTGRKLPKKSKPKPK